LIILDEFFDEEQTFVSNIGFICLKLSTFLEENEHRAAAQERCGTVARQWFWDVTRFPSL
jgi:hypothetical protein